MFLLLLRNMCMYLNGYLLLLFYPSCISGWTSRNSKGPGITKGPENPEETSEPFGKHHFACNYAYTDVLNVAYLSLAG